MDIGGALAAARSQAGLTIAQVSERTRIRATIIRAIEQNDYALCGGDFYARGHIRAIARVVGMDPVPLIQQYDQDHAAPHPGSEGIGTGASPRFGRAGTGDPSRHVVIGGSADGAAGTGGRTRPHGITAAEAFRPAMPLQIEGARRLPVRTGLVGLLALAVIAILAYLLASQAPAPVHTGSHATASRTHHHPPPTPAATSVTASPTQTLLPIATAQAFGPAGLSQGDNPQGASLAIDGNPGTAWHTDWYAQANVNGKPGTGLLLDLGNTVNVSSVQLMLGPAAGGTVQLRAGNAPSLAELPVIAQAAIPGGTMTLQPGSPASARYVLIWFTQLPPDSAGTYQAYVYNVSVSGTT